MDFKTAYKLPIGDHVEKKGKFSYLSWCYAVQHLRENFKEATWEIKENDSGQPLFSMPKGFMVCVTVIVDGFKFPQWHPILDFKNKPIQEPNAFDVNTAIQRCLTKAIGLATGIGLGLYAGEDLPKEPKKEKEPKKKLADFTQQADTMKTLETLNKWVEGVSLEVRSNLNETDCKKFGAYIVQLRDVFAPQEEKKEKQEFVTCPMNNSKMQIADCKVSGDCNTTCKVYAEAIK